MPGQDKDTHSCRCEMNCDYGVGEVGHEFLYFKVLKLFFYKKE